MTVKMETCMKTDWLYSRVMTYRLLSEMLQRRPTLSKLIEWRKEADASGFYPDRAIR
ncbi:hypothetical protein [Paenibacillus bovis]|uniref:hypothetical protein n=1 Tax=Paenibacillus bovis TaxID=1616788 RepID=UPI000ADBE567|nr:hypothetical protein [Paenibacillus bovis]